MSELRSFIEGLRAETVAEFPDARIQDDFSELQRTIEQLESERLRRLAELDRRGLYRRDDFLSTAAWLVASFGLTWGAARDQVRVARALDDLARPPGARVKATYRCRPSGC